MGDLVAVVSVSKRGTVTPIDVQLRVSTLQALFDACRDAPPSDVVRVSIQGSEGEVRLNFASFIKAF
jgi:hypothetical protein